jgi:hypothetical protein
MERAGISFNETLAHAHSNKFLTPQYSPTISIIVIPELSDFCGE